MAWWLSHLSFTNNLLTAVHGYSPVPFTAHLWTISLEEQAYFIIPLLLIACRGISSRTLMFACLAAAIMLLTARYAFVLAETPHPFIWVLPLRADAFILGAAAAILVSRDRIDGRVWMMAVGALALASVVLFPNIDQSGPYQIFGYLIVAVGATALVLGSQAQGVNSSPLASSPMRYLGKISYGIYVYHLLAIAIAEKVRGVSGLHPGIGFPLAFLVTIVIAAASYQWLERPFLKMKRRYERVESRPI